MSEKLENLALRFLNSNTALFMLFILIACIVVCSYLFFPFMEARSYNKYCKEKVTTWDAIFLDLRIDMCEKVPQKGDE